MTDAPSGPGLLTILRPAWSAVVGLLVMGLAAAFALPGHQDSADVRAEQKFLHTDHVQKAWYLGEESEVWRDCRGCHRYADPQGSRDPQRVCANCHFRGGFNLETDPGYEQDLDALRSRVAIAGFDHVEHLDLTCRQCHDPRREEAFDPDLLPPSIHLPAGIGVCVECHDPDPGGLRVKLTPMGQREVRDPHDPEIHASILARLDESVEMGPGALARFRHDEHMPLAGTRSPDLAGGAGVKELVSAAATDRTCGSCHRPAFHWSGTAVPSPEFSTADPNSCGECHIQGPDGRALRFTEAPAAPRPSLAAGTFDHDLHLKVDVLEAMRGALETAAQGERRCTSQAYLVIRERGCVVCHAWDENAAEYLVSAPLVGDRREAHSSALFEGCVSCHKPWDTYHEDWSAERVNGEPGACTACHAFGEGDMATTRLRVSLERPDPDRWPTLTQNHPFIVDPIDAKCSECHLTPVKELPSRIPDRRFNHDTHLPAVPREQDCLSCHGDVARSGSPLEIALSFDESACANCHRGERLSATTKKKRVETLLFPHDLHMNREWTPPGAAQAQKIGCITCHEAADWAAPEVGIPDDVADCTRCHDHERSPEITGGLGRAEVRSCGKCHTQRAGGVPRPASDLTAHPSVAHHTIEAVSGTQHHPPGRACAECHLPSTWQATPFHGSAVGAASARQDVHQALTLAEQEAGVHLRPLECMDCHWSGQMNGMLEDPRAHRESHGDKTLSQGSLTSDGVGKQGASPRYPGRADQAALAAKASGTQ